MTFGTGPQALVDYLQSNWQPSRAGRTDIPDWVGNQSGGAAENYGVIITQDRDEVANQHAVHDLVHVYHPQASGLDVQDKGYQEQGVVENVQVDIECTDRTDPSTGERLDASTRMVGDRGDPAFSTSVGGGPYPGLAGEVKYILELARRGFKEYDVASHNPVNIVLENSNATVSFDVELEFIAENTADA